MKLLLASKTALVKVSIISHITISLDHAHSEQPCPRSYWRVKLDCKRAFNFRTTSDGVASYKEVWQQGFLALFKIVARDAQIKNIEKELISEKKTDEVYRFS